MMQKTAASEITTGNISLSSKHFTHVEKNPASQEQHLGDRHVSNTMNCNDNDDLKKPVHKDLGTLIKPQTFTDNKPEDGTDAGFSIPMTFSLSVSLHSDEKKRPLSISSTSSSNSSSSLPRHVKKRIANMLSSTVTSISATAETGGTDDANCDVLSTVVEYSPADFPCSSSGSHFFDGKDVIADEERMDLVCCPLDGSQITGLDNYAQQNMEDFPVASDAEEAVCLILTTDGRDLGPLTGTVYIERVVTEILETERNYVKDLTDIVQGYTGQMRKYPELDLSSHDHAALFGNIEEICEFNKNFLSKLEKCDHDPIKMADCFVSETAGFVIYSTYCTNYPRSMETLVRCMKDTKIATILKQQQISLQHGLPLGSYLLKPVQRILKYNILLQNILNNHDPLDEGHTLIEKALEAMTNVALHINEMKRQHEHAVRIQEVQSHLYGWDGDDLTTLGDLILEDRFRVCGAKAMRQLFLFHKALLITKEKDDGILLVKGFILFSNLMVIESVPKEPLSFQVIPFNSPKEQCTLQARNLEQKRHWCHWIKKLMLENYGSKIPEKAKELVMMLGKSREEEDYESSSLEIPELVKKQHSAPEYLERRKGNRKSAGLIPDLKIKSRRGRRRNASSNNDSNNSKSEPSESCVEKIIDVQLVPDDDEYDESFSSNCDGDDNKLLNNDTGINSKNGGGSSIMMQRTNESYKSNSSFSSVISDETAEDFVGVSISDLSPTPVTLLPLAARGEHSASAADLKTLHQATNKLLTSTPHYKATHKGAILTSQSSTSLQEVLENDGKSNESLFCRSNSITSDLHKCSNCSVSSTDSDMQSVQVNWPHSLGQGVAYENQSNSLVPSSPLHYKTGLNLNTSDQNISQSSQNQLWSSISSHSISSSSSTPLPLYSPAFEHKDHAQTPKNSHVRDYSKPMNLHPYNLQPNVYYYDNIYDKDIEDQDGLLNSVQCVLTKLSSRLPVNSLQNDLSFTSTIESSDKDADSIKSDSSSVKSEDRKESKNKLARLLGKSQNGQQRKVNRLTANGNASPHTGPSLANMLKDGGLGSSTIGERMAVSSDSSFDSVFTLVSRSPHRHTSLFDSKDTFKQIPTENDSSVQLLSKTSLIQNVPATSSTPQHQGFCKNNSGDIQVQLKNTDHVGEDAEHRHAAAKPEIQVSQTAAVAESQLSSDEGTIDNEAEFYYENKLLQDLEDDLNTVNHDFDFKDVCYDNNEAKCEGTQDFVKCIEAPSPQTKIPVPRMTIKETLHSIERRSHARPVRKVEVQLAEKAQGIREIMQTLENVNKNCQGNSMCSYTTFPGTQMFLQKTDRSRTRELAECASITRVRQNSCNIVGAELQTQYNDCSKSTLNQDNNITESPALRNEVSHL